MDVFLIASRGRAIVSPFREESENGRLSIAIYLLVDAERERKREGLVGLSIDWK